MDSAEIYQAPSANLDSWNRTLCGVLDEMRTCYKTRNFAPLQGLIEEAQTYGNRMESKLSDVRQYERLKERYKALKAEIVELEKQTGKRQPQIRSRIQEMLEEV